MEMRNKYVAPGAAIHYFLTEWDPLDLSWSDFRSQLLGPTDPSTAVEDSLRGSIYASWEELGLSCQPDIANNGVHSSASPFEALSERMNWLSAKPEEDPFGQLLLHGGVTTKHIEEWALDPQVTYISQGKSTTCSLYDALEDLDADRCVTQCQLIVGDEGDIIDETELSGEQAEALHRRGNILRTSHVDGYDVYTFKYILEDSDSAGMIWEVCRDLQKLDHGRYDVKPIWTARKLTVAEAQQVLSQASPTKASERRSPLSNRLPGRVQLD
mmetsp:Transcript_71106/g.179531  ORF Transcript_71106/g.179531 Transcript_71106/m.179531 type:complete len:270 (-) Transcript_71106:460-1269(-)